VGAAIADRAGATVSKAVRAKSRVALEIREEDFLELDLALDITRNSCQLAYK
jgi:hypothetical protein